MKQSEPKAWPLDPSWPPAPAVPGQPAPRTASLDKPFAEILKSGQNRVPETRTHLVDSPCTTGQPGKHKGYLCSHRTQEAQVSLV